MAAAPTVEAVSRMGSPTFDVADALPRFIDAAYHAGRPHSAQGYPSPMRLYSGLGRRAAVGPSNSAP